MNSPSKSFDNKAYHKAYRETHKAKQAAYLIEWHKQNPEYNRERTRRARLEILEHYGNKCACCGETTFEFLCLDHINGGGRQHREAIGGNNVSLCRWLKKQGWPSGFQVLCHNCNMAKGFYGHCPHETMKEVTINERCVI